MFYSYLLNLYFILSFFLHLSVKYYYNQNMLCIVSLNPEEIIIYFFDGKITCENP